MAPNRGLANLAAVQDRIALVRGLLGINQNGPFEVIREVSFDTPFGRRRYDGVVRNRTTGEASGIKTIRVTSEWPLLKAQALFAQALAPGWIGEIFQSVLGSQVLKFHQDIPDFPLVIDGFFEPDNLFST